MLINYNNKQISANSQREDKLILSTIIIEADSFLTRLGRQVLGKKGFSTKTKLRIFYRNVKLEN